MNIELVKADDLDRGERAIMVDGVRWGNTIVTMHGVNGTRHRFMQANGETIIEKPDAKYPKEVQVRSQKRRLVWRGDKLVKDPDWKPVEERVLETAKELIQAGKLRHPDIIKAEVEARRKAYKARMEERECEQAAEFDRRAREALQINDTAPSPLVDRVVAAMRWAQQK